MKNFQIITSGRNTFDLKSKHFKTLKQRTYPILDFLRHCRWLELVTAHVLHLPIITSVKKLNKAPTYDSTQRATPNWEVKNAGSFIPTKTHNFILL